MIEAKKNIVWLASYPKSGNTWVRLFLQNLLNEGEEPLDINAPLAKNFRHSANAAYFNYNTLLKHTVLKPEEISYLRLQAYSQVSTETTFLKTHDSFDSLVNAADYSKAAIYIVRHPLDVSISFAHYFNLTYDESIVKMNNHHFSLAKMKKNGTTQLPQLVGNWSQHVRSWIDQTEIPLLLVKYEDLLDSPVESFSRITKFLQLSKRREDVLKAIELSSFKQLKTQEEEKGFKEQFSSKDVFFRKGEKNEWKTTLTSSQVDQFNSGNSEMIRRLDYLLVR